MTTRSTAMGIVALLTGILVLFMTEAALAAVIGIVLLLLGLAITMVAVLRGVHDSPEASQRAATAAQHRDAELSMHMKRASETGRWPRVIGGG